MKQLEYALHKEDFDKHVLNMKSQFLEKGYCKHMTDSQMGKVKFGQILKPGSKQTGVYPKCKLIKS